MCRYHKRSSPKSGQRGGPVPRGNLYIQSRACLVALCWSFSSKRLLAKVKNSITKSHPRSAPLTGRHTTLASSRKPYLIGSTRSRTNGTTMDGNTPPNLLRGVADVASMKQKTLVYRQVFVSIGGWTFSDPGTPTQPLFSEIARILPITL